MSVSINKHTPAYYTLLCKYYINDSKDDRSIASITMITIDIVLERNGTVGTE